MLVVKVLRSAVEPPRVTGTATRLAILCSCAATALVLIPAASGGAATSSRTVTQPTAVRAVAWRSGASGDGVASGAFGRWRGTPVTIGGTWNDTYAAQPAQSTLTMPTEWGRWRLDLDDAVGAIFKSRGESWRAAARGAYDQRWRRALQRMRSAWGSRPGTLFLRFAHEFNGDWTDWSVSGGEVRDFVTAWRRFRGLQRSIMPRARLVFCPNDGSATRQRLDWRKAFPGKQYVDVMGVDSYNQEPFVRSAAAFTRKSLARDRYGAPMGVEQHRRFAASVGLPLAVPEWSTNADAGDGAAFVRAFHNWMAAHAGTGAGSVLYEIQFNVGSYGGGRFRLFPSTRMPLAAAAYAAAF